MIDLTMPVSCAVSLLGGALIGLGVDAKIQKIYDYTKCAFFGNDFYKVPGWDRYDENRIKQGTLVFQSADCDGFFDHWSVAILSVAVSSVLVGVCSSFFLTAAPGVKLALLVGSVALPIFMAFVRNVGRSTGAHHDVQVVAPLTEQNRIVDTLKDKRYADTYTGFPFPWNDQPHRGCCY